MTVYNAGDIYLEDLSGGTSDQIHIYAQTDNIADGAITAAKLYDKMHLIAVDMAYGVSRVTGSYIRWASGATNTNADYERTVYIDVSGHTRLAYTRYVSTTTVQMAGGMAFYAEQASSSYVSGDPWGYGATEDHYEIREVDVPEGASYAVFSYPVSLSDGFAVYDAGEYNASVVALARSAKIEADNNAASIEDTAGRVGLSWIYDNLWAVGSITHGLALTPAGGTMTNADYDTSDFIPVNMITALVGNGARYWFYDAEKAIISGTTGIFENAPEIVSGAHLVEVPEGASYFRMSILNTGFKRLYAVTPYELYLKSMAEKPAPTVKLYCIGDSITRGMYAEYGASSSSGPTAYGYPYWIGQENNYDVVNLGESGGGYALKGSQTSSNGKDIVDANTFDDADIITIAFGVNDYKTTDTAITLGSMASTSGDGSVIGNMKYMIETLFTKAPTATVIVMLPMNQNRFGSANMSFDTNWSFGYAFRENKTLADYRAAIRECAEYYNVRVIDEEEVCGINRINIRYMCGDGLHPTRAFYKDMGRALAPFVK